MKRRMPLKVLSAVLVTAFLFQEISFANPDLKAIDWNQINQADHKAWARKLLPRIPESVATLEDAWRAPVDSRIHGNDTPLVYLIADAHTNESGQINLAKTLNLLLSSSSKAPKGLRREVLDSRLPACRQAWRRSLEQETYPNLSLYLQYLKQAQKISPQEILKEQKLLEDQVFQALAQTPDEQTLFEVSKNVRDLRKLFNLTLTPEEYQTYEKDPRGFNIAFITGFLNRKIMDLGTLYEKTTLLLNFH